MTHLHAYAKWLENENLDWWHFPVKASERCLVRFRGSLMDSIEKNGISGSTAQQRMAAVIRFYRWLLSAGLLSAERPLWRDSQISIRITDSFGLHRTINKNSSDLTIKNRVAIGFNLEDGLMPIANDDVIKILKFSDEHASVELAMMLRLGFGTGMRIGTISDLKVETINRAVPLIGIPGLYCIAVGPGAHPPVHTKFAITGQIWISEADLSELRKYIFSTRRLIRQAQALPNHRDNIFLTRYGNPYSPQEGSTSKAINVEIGRLRELGSKEGVSAFYNFRFHQTRCTFATELARLALQHGNPSIALSLVKQALLHKNESTTLKYIKFVENTEVMGKISDEFTRKFLGLISYTGTPNS